MEFWEPLAQAENYPSVIVKAYPTEIKGQGHIRMLPTDVLSVMYLDKGRSGLYLLAMALDSSTVWLPSYHCPALVEPFIEAGKNISFYPVSSQLDSDEEFLKRNVKSGDTVLVVRYFGFEGNLQAVSKVCNQNKAFLIEDLAHAAMVNRIYGDAAITSLTKFYPKLSAGELLIRCEGVVHTRVMQHYNQLQSRRRYKIKQKLSRLLNIFDKAHLATKYFDIDIIHRLESNYLMKSVGSMNQSEISELRRTNYQRIANAVNSSSSARVLFSLDEKTVPYVVPVVATDKLMFDSFRHSGIQVLRWEELSKEVDQPDILAYRHYLLQIPCHQDLTTSQLHQIENIISRH